MVVYEIEKGKFSGFFMRLKNWVLSPGLQYGVDFVAYRHHPSLVHSEYAVIVLSEGDVGRLRVWSDIQTLWKCCENIVSFEC